MPSALLARRPPPTLDELAAERARRHLGAFIRDAWHVVEPQTPYVHGWHIDCIAAHLEAVSAGQIRDLLITVPPRCMKSLTVSVFWPTWVWATRPAFRWLFASYAESLSIRDSLKCRRIIQSRWYQARWGHVFALTGDQNVKGRFENDRTGYRIASSVGGANTGEGGDAVVIDDPHNIEEAESDLIREGTLRWFDEVMPTRLNDPKTGARVVIQQRCHEEDVAGHVLKRGTWHHLNLPMEYEPRVYVQPGQPEHAAAQPHDACPIATDPRAEEGELLCAERFGPDELAKLKLDLGPYASAGQLQQRPVPRAGAVFRSEWFRPLPDDFDRPIVGEQTRRSRLATVQFWDLAFSAKDSADYTCAVTMGVDEALFLYLLHVLRVRVDERDLADVMADHIAFTRPGLVGVEEAAFKKFPTADLVQRVYQKLAGSWPARIWAVPVTADKVFRAQLPAGRGAAGMLFADRAAVWWPAFETEILRFPKASHDDQVDGLSGATELAIKGAPQPRAAPQFYSFAPTRSGARMPEMDWERRMLDAPPTPVRERQAVPTVGPRW